MDKRILVICIHGPYEPWLSILREGQLKTWMDTKTSVRVVNAFGKKIGPKKQMLDQRIYFLRWSPRKIVAYISLALEAMIKKLLVLDSYKPSVRVRADDFMGEVWDVKMPDSLMLQGIKNMAVFRESLNHDFDFLVTTITSSYINLNLLNEALSEVETHGFAGGRIEHTEKLFYQQGSFRIYSRDVVSNLVRNSSKYKHWNIEDIAMGKLVARLGYELSEVKNLTIQTINQVDQLNVADLQTTVSYRCKSIENDERRDPLIMKKLHQRIFECK